MFARTGWVMLFFCITGLTTAQDSTAEQDEAAPSRIRKLLDGSVERFEVLPIRINAPSMTSQPALVWINNERDSHSVGKVVLWIDRGTPAAAMATYLWADQFHIEFDLLSRNPVVVKEQGTVIWQPKTGLSFKPIPNAPAVEAAASARLRQMKSISEQFSATMLGWRADSSDRTELRRMPRELFRYQPEDAQIIDGAVFAFVQGTDPEALLVIEAVRVKNGSEWQYAFVRQTSGELEGRLHGNVVWNAERYPDRTAPTAQGLTLNNVSLK